MDAPARQASRREATLTPVRNWPRGLRIGLLIGVAVFLVSAVLALGGASQNQAFHAFANTDAFGIAHFGNVASNLPYLVVGLIGLGAVRRRWIEIGGWAVGGPFVALFAGFALVTFGSASYHAAPTDASLAWDRAPMTIIFGAGLAMVLADRVLPRRAAPPMLLALLLFGLAAVVAWRYADDLRLYRIDQGLGTLVALSAAALFPGRVTHLGLALAMVAIFGAATMCEAFDREIYTALGGAVSGHVIKHLGAALAGVPAILMITRFDVGASRS